MWLKVEKWTFYSYGFTIFKLTLSDNGECKTQEFIGIRIELRRSRIELYLDLDIHTLTSRP